MQHQIVREASGKDQRRALDRQHHAGLLQARNLLGIGGAQRRRDGLLDRRQADDDHRLRIVE